MKNLAGLMKQASQMQAKMEEMQSRLEQLSIEGTAGAGMVTVTLSGKGDLRGIKIDPKLADPGGPDRRRARRGEAASRGALGGRDAGGDRGDEPAARPEAAVLNRAWAVPRSSA